MSGLISYDQPYRLVARYLGSPVCLIVYLLRGERWKYEKSRRTGRFEGQVGKIVKKGGDVALGPSFTGQVNKYDLIYWEILYPSKVG